MPAEFEKQQRVFMIWPYRGDNWRDDAVHAQKAYVEVARAIAEFEPVTMLVPRAQMKIAVKELYGIADLLKMESDDAWCRDCGPTFLVDGRGGIRACDWTFNAWGGAVDGLYDSWERDDRIAGQLCAFLGIDTYRTENFVLEGGSFHVDGEGTVLTTEMCLLSAGRNPSMNKAQIEQKLCEYLGAEKVIWIRDGIDPEETNGHIDDVACYVRPGEVACIWTDDPGHPFYHASHDAYETLSESTDARGRRLVVHRIPCTERPVRIGNFLYTQSGHAISRREGDLCIASYLNFLIVNGGVIVPQYDDPMDERALAAIQELFPDRRAVGVRTREIVYGGGNIHCITQQMPAV